MIQELWKQFIEANPTNNMNIKKYERIGFYKGAEAMREHMNAEIRLYDEMSEETKQALGIVGALSLGATVVLVVDNDER